MTGKVRELCYRKPVGTLTVVIAIQHSNQCIL